MSANDNFDKPNHFMVHLALVEK